MADVAVADDWIFSWSARRFAADGVIEVLPISGPTAVFEALIGGIAGLGGSPSFGVLRLSTVILTGVSAIALWKIVETRLQRPVVRGLVVAAYLFNPLTLSLTFSFMTDAHALALTMIAIAFYDRGLKGPRATASLLLGASVAALAFLSRPQTLVVVVGVVAAGLLGKPRFSLLKVAASAVVPLVMVVGERIRSGGTSAMQEHHLGTLMDSSASDHLLNLVIATASAIGFVGVFAVPVWVGRWRLSEMRSLTMRIVAPLSLMVLAFNGLFPFGDDWIGKGGVGAGPPFVYLSPDRANSGWVPALWPIGLTVAAVLFSASFFEAVVRFIRRWPIDATTAFAGVGLATAYGGVVASSLFFAGAPPNRYFLPLLPWVLLLTVPAISSLDHRPILGWVIVLVFGIMSVVGIHDSLEAEKAIWGLATGAINSGVPLDELSASAAWDGYHFGPETAAASAFDPDFRDSPTWWLPFYAPQIDPGYLVVVSVPPLAYEILEVADYPRWGWGLGRAYLVRVPMAG